MVLGYYHPCKCWHMNHKAFKADNRKKLKSVKEMAKNSMSILDYIYPVNLNYLKCARQFENQYW